MIEIRDSVLELIRLCATDLPADVEEAIVQAREKEKQGSIASNVLREILENIGIARNEGIPLCQDTGTLVFYVDYPLDLKQRIIFKAITTATKMATRKHLLRPNSMDTLSNHNTGNNIGIGHPFIHYNQWNRKYLSIRLMLKGGGSENVGVQYCLPDESIDAFRDLDGVSRCVIDGVYRAQGKGCSPTIVGVGIGGDRATSYLLAKKQLFRKLNEHNPLAELDRMEKQLHQKLNRLGIGPMGLGGKTTVLSVKIGAANRIPASYFVSLSFACWACRRYTLTLRNGVPSYD